MTTEQEEQDKKEARDAAQELTRRQMVDLLMQHDPADVDERTTDLLATVYERSMDALRAMIVADARQVGVEESEIEGMVEGFDIFRGDLEPVIKMAVLTGMCAAQVGLVPYSSTAPSPYDMIDYLDTVERDDFTTRVEGKGREMHEGFERHIVSHYANVIATQTEIGQLDPEKPHDLVNIIYNGVLGYVAVMEVVREDQRRLKGNLLQELDGAMLERLLRIRAMSNGGHGPIA